MSDVALKRIYSESRDHYMLIMQGFCSPDTKSATKESLRGFHRQEVKSAVASFRTKAKALGANAKTIDNNAIKLTEELNKHEEEFFKLNLQKTEQTVARSIEAYFKTIDKFTHGILCVNELDVENLHEEATAAFKKVFKANRRSDHAGEDCDMNDTAAYLMMKLNEQRLINTRNNKLYGIEISKSYFQEMLGKCTGISKEEFNNEHEKSRQKYLAVFASKRNRQSHFKVDSLKIEVDRYMMLQYNHLKQINASRNKDVVERTVAAYERTALAPSFLWQYCIHPEDLKKNHQDALCRALQAFSPNRTCTEFNDSNKDELNIRLLLENRYRTLADVNTISNEIATEAGFLEFMRTFNTTVNRNGNMWYKMTQILRLTSYDKAVVVGVDTFYSKRRDRKYVGADSFKDNMIRRCKGYAQVESLPTLVNEGTNY